MNDDWIRIQGINITTRYFEPKKGSQGGKHWMQVCAQQLPGHFVELTNQLLPEEEKKYPVSPARRDGIMHALAQYIRSRIKECFGEDTLIVYSDPMHGRYDIGVMRDLDFFIAIPAGSYGKILKEMDELAMQPLPVILRWGEPERKGIKRWQPDAPADRFEKIADAIGVYCGEFLDPEEKKIFIGKIVRMQNYDYPAIRAIAPQSVPDRNCSNLGAYLANMMLKRGTSRTDR